MNKKKVIKVGILLLTITTIIFVIIFFVVNTGDEKKEVEGDIDLVNKIFGVDLSKEVTIREYKNNLIEDEYDGDLVLCLELNDSELDSLLKKLEESYSEGMDEALENAVKYGFSLKKEEISKTYHRLSGVRRHIDKEYIFIPRTILLLVSIIEGDNSSNTVWMSYAE